MAVPVRRPRRLGPLLTASAALHLSILILLLLTIDRRPREVEAPPPADFAMVFEGHSPERNSAPNPELAHPSRPGSPAPTTSVPAVPAAPPSVAVLPPPPPPPPAPQAASPQAPAPQAPAPQAPAPQAPAPQAPAAVASAVPAPPPPPVTPAPPETKVPPEAKVPPTEPAPKQLAMVVPRPPPIPATPSPSQPPHPAQARPERRPEREPAFPTPLAFSFGLPGATTSQSTSPRTATTTASAPARLSRPDQPGSMDMSFGPIEGGSLSPSSSVQMEGVSVSTDWLNLVSAWWQRHAYYPPQAAVNGEEGDVLLHMRVDHDGRVEALEVMGRSGSQWLDLGAQSIFRDAHLPPLPADMSDAQIPFHVTIHYVIIRAPRIGR